jgi:hypothetical protein
VKAGTAVIHKDVSVKRKKKNHNLLSSGKNKGFTSDDVPGLELVGFLEVDALEVDARAFELVSFCSLVSV